MVYVTGDMHGDIARFDSPAVKRLKKGDTLIICGDFGFVWDNSKAEQKTLKKLGSKKYNICFIDGTHENFELLNAYPVTEWCGGKVLRQSLSPDERAGLPYRQHDLLHHGRRRKPRH